MNSAAVASEKQLETGDGQSRYAGKGPFILAKVIVSYLSKKKQVRVQEIRIGNHHDVLLILSNVVLSKSNECISNNKILLPYSVV